MLFLSKQPISAGALGAQYPFSAENVVRTSRGFPGSWDFAGTGAAFRDGPMRASAPAFLLLFQTMCRHRTIPDQLAHALAVGPADHTLPAGALGAQGHCSLASVPIPSGAQRPNDTRPAVHALAVDHADHALPAWAPGTQGHCSLASVPTPSGAQQPIDSRPAVHAPSAATRR